MTPDRAAVDRIRSEYAQCFGCGLENLAGLHIDGFEVTDSAVTAPFAPRESFAGFEGVLHGGIVATALDEISAWSAMLAEGVFVFTAKLNLSYRKNVPTGEHLELSAKVTERRGRRLWIDAELSHQGAKLAESAGVFVVASELGDR